MEIANVSMNALITLFIILTIFSIGLLLIGGYVYPLTKSLNPEYTNAEGISETQYDDMADSVWTGMKRVFYGLIAVIFFYIVVRILFKKEETSVGYQGGYY